jgi:glycosyltransferase involved in cell wall biosynthesis
MKCPLLNELPPPPADKTGWPWTEETPRLPDAMPDGSSWPLISIVTPSYNREEFLEETIRSVLLQGYPALEFFIIDGGSTDHSVEVIRKYEKWLAGWVSEKDRGEYHAINKGLPQCRGEVITFHNSDDYYLPGAFGDAAMRWAQDKGCGVIAGAFYYVDGEKMRDHPIPAAIPNAGPVDLVITLEPWRLHQVALFFTRHALDAVGRTVSEEFEYNGDREILYRVCRQFRTVLSERPYAAFRWHVDGKSISNMFEADMDYANLHLSYHYDDPEKERLKRLVASRRRAKGFYRYARMHGASLKSVWAVVKAPCHDPRLLRQLRYYGTWLRAVGLRSDRRQTSASA